MKKRIDIVTLYKILANPYPLYTRDIKVILGCAENKALDYKKAVQNYVAAKTGKVVNPNYITKEMLLEYEGWKWEDIRNEALILIAAQNGIVSA